MKKNSDNLKGGDFLTHTVYKHNRKLNNKITTPVTSSDTIRCDRRV